MKKTLFFILIFLSFINISYAIQKGEVYCPDNEDPVSLRPSVTAAATEGLVCRTTVEVLDTNAGTNPTSGCTKQYYYVRQGMKVGYACGDFIRLQSETTEGKVLCIEDRSPLWMYSDKTRTTKVGSGLSCDTKVEVLDKNAGEDGRTTNKCPTSLYKIRYNGVEGYVCGRYIGDSSSSSSSEVNPSVGKGSEGDNIYKKENYQNPPSLDGTIKCYEDTGDLPLRSAPGGGTVVGSLSCGADVKINSTKESSGICPYYYNVTSSKGESGYVCSYYVGTTKLSEKAETYYKEKESKEEYSQKLRSLGFPDSYLPYLLELHARHPNWSFNPEIINLTFEEVVAGENSYGRNLLEGSAFNKNYLSMGINNYDILTDTFKTYSTEKGWYDASSEAVAFYLDPRTYLNEKYILAFELLNYNSAHTEEAVSKILTKKSFWNTVYQGKDSNVARDIVNGTREIGISSFHIAARIEQEISSISTTDPRAGGSFTLDGVGYSGYYNFFNIDVWGQDKILRGMRYAVNNGWNTPAKGIYGGSKFIYNDYYAVNQDTLYYEKFDVSTIDGNYTHQYMQNLAVVAQETNKVYKTYMTNISNYYNEALSFTIPVYKDMPSHAVSSPKLGNPNNYLSDLKVNGNTISSFSYDKYDYSINMPASTKSVNISATKIVSTANVSGTGDIKVAQGDNKIVVTVTAENTNTRKYTINVNVKEEPIPSEVEDINTILNKSGIKYNDDYIYGINENTSINSLINNITSAYDYATVVVKDKNGNNKSNTIFATGDQVIIGNSKEEKIMHIVIYGDINSDGKIDKDDCLAILRYLKGYANLDSYYKISADGNKDGKIDKDDCLAILRHMKGYTNLNK